MFIIDVMYFFVVLATSCDVGQWQKYVKALFYIKLVALDGLCYSFICTLIELLTLLTLSIPTEHNFS
jgi:hypothetical protein